MYVVSEVVDMTSKLDNVAGLTTLNITYYIHFQVRPTEISLMSDEILSLPK